MSSRGSKGRVGLGGTRSSQGTRSSRGDTLVSSASSRREHSVKQSLWVVEPKFWMNFSTIFPERRTNFGGSTSEPQALPPTPPPSPSTPPAQHFPKNSGQAVQSTTELSVDVCSLFLFNFSQIWSRFVNLKNFFCNVFVERKWHCTEVKKKHVHKTVL